MLVASHQPQSPRAQTVYLYGLSRIGELQPGGFLYHLTDALGSVRQLVDETVTVRLVQSCEPYDKVPESTGSGSSIYGYDGEQQNGALIYLRARLYNSGFVHSRISR